MAGVLCLVLWVNAFCTGWVPLRAEMFGNHFGAWHYYYFGDRLLGKIGLLALLSSASAILSLPFAKSRLGCNLAIVAVLVSICNAIFYIAVMMD